MTGTSTRFGIDMLSRGLFFVWAIFPALAPGQEKQECEDRMPLLREMRDIGNTVVVVDNLEVVVSDIKRLAADLGHEDLASKFLHMTPGLNEVTHPGVIYYSDAGLGVLRTKSRGELARLMNLPIEEPVDGEFYEMPIGDYIPLKALHEIEDESVFWGDNLLFTPSWGPRRFDESIAMWRDAADKPLWPRLDPASQDIVASTGISIVSAFDDGGAFFDAFVGEVEDGFSDKLNEREIEWLKEFSGIASRSNRQVFGIKYHERVLELRARAQLAEGDSLDNMIRRETSVEDWKPDRGLVSDRLVLALSFQTNAFSSPAPFRCLPRLGLYCAGHREQLHWLQGNMVGILAELMGDSWNDINAGRLAFYESADAPKLGKFAIIGVVDAKDSAAVLEQLEYVARLTGPLANSDKAAERDEEIMRLIGELASDDHEAAARAETRLVLAGRAAIAPLKDASRALNHEQKRAVERILKRLGEIDPENAERLAFTDPAFWTTLNPGLWLERNTGRVAGFNVHKVEITADPSKTPEEVQGAVAIMLNLFGPGWDKVQIVEVRDHFVFMIGSDNELLEKTIANVEWGAGELSKALEGVGDSAQTGQIQAWMNGHRLMKLFLGEEWPEEQKPDDIDKRPIWLSLDLSGQSGDFKALIPIDQVGPVVRFLLF